MTPTLLQRLRPWVGMAVAAGALTAAALVHPVDGHPDRLTLFGWPFGMTCTFLDLTGLPCPSCGMTRAWVWAVRGEVALALRYNVAGVGLLAAIVTYGILRPLGGSPGGGSSGGGSSGGGARLRRRGGRVVAALAIAWGLVWMGGWAIRLAGGWPIP